MVALWIIMFLAGNIMYIYYTFSQEELHLRQCTSRYFNNSCVFLCVPSFVLDFIQVFPLILCSVSHFILTFISFRERSCSCLLLSCEYFVFISFFLFPERLSICLSVAFQSTIQREKHQTSLLQLTQMLFSFLLQPHICQAQPEQL